MSSDIVTDTGGDRQLAEFREQIGRHFVRAEPRQRVWAYITMLLSEQARKNAWAISLRAGERSPDGMQRLVRNAGWDVEGVRDAVRQFVVEQIGSADPADGVLVAGATEFVKRGDRTVAVERQYVPARQRRENCQIGVLAGYATGLRCALIDRELYLPESWASSPERRRTAGIPDHVTAEPQAELARRIVARSLKARLPVGCLVSVEPYGRHAPLLDWLDERGLPYLLGMDGPGLTSVRLAGDPANLPDTFRVSPLFWNRTPAPGGAGRWILSSGGDSGMRFICGGPSGRAPLDVVPAVFASMAFRRCIDDARARAGLDAYQLRTYQGWYRHITLALAASACLLPSR
ncbi:transposase [Micromonospora sp. NPDC049240]|uniref:IS701 family transposase n=1 Tax=Micromonospora sp. NPDC049240 TaxID=3155151 RepID=UPI0033DE189C